MSWHVWYAVQECRNTHKGRKRERDTHAHTHVWQSNMNEGLGKKKKGTASRKVASTKAALVFSAVNQNFSRVESNFFFTDMGFSEKASIIIRFAPAFTRSRHFHWNHTNLNCTCSKPLFVGTLKKKKKRRLGLIFLGNALNSSPCLQPEWPKGAGDHSLQCPGTFWFLGSAHWNIQAGNATEKMRANLQARLRVNLNIKALCSRAGVHLWHHTGHGKGRTSFPVLSSVLCKGEL